ncbi:MAG TPA: alkaline phosphatase family protein [Acidimicrobiales bacterium]|jgi:hypothetical protein
MALPRQDVAPGPRPLLPDYGGACITNVVRALTDGGPPPAWLPAPAVGAAQVVLFVLDGLGWDQLRERPGVAPTLASMVGGPITSVAPTTTAVALTSITTGLTPAQHEVLGYRVRVAGDEVLNVLRWRTAAGDARQQVVPSEFQTHPTFGGTTPAVVTRAEFAATGFTVAHLAGTRLHGWRMASSLAVEVGALLAAGEPLVYAYYDGIDKVAHEHGFGAFYDAELRAADRLAADLAADLPPGAAMVVTADHGQVEVGDASLMLTPELLGDTVLVSGEGRFRWLHARPGCAARLREAAEAQFGHLAWIRSVDELEADGWFGGRLSPAGRSRLGDVALIPYEPVAFTDPRDTGELALRCRHGSATAAEMLVPLVAFAPGA